jgi:hypothetical protein
VFDRIYLTGDIHAPWLHDRRNPFFLRGMMSYMGIQNSIRNFWRYLDFGAVVRYKWFKRGCARRKLFRIFPSSIFIRKRGVDRRGSAGTLCWRRIWCVEEGRQGGDLKHTRSSLLFLESRPCTVPALPRTFLLPPFLVLSTLPALK